MNVASQGMDATLRSFLVCADKIDLSVISEWVVFEGQKARKLGDEGLVCVVTALDGIVFCRAKGFWDDEKCRKGVGAVLRAYFSMKESNIKTF